MTDLLHLYVDALRRFRYVFLLLWLGIAVSSAFFVMDFISSCSLNFSPPKGTHAHRALQLRADHFPAAKAQADMSLFAKIERAALSSPKLLLSSSLSAQQGSYFGGSERFQNVDSILNTNNDDDNDKDMASVCHKTHNTSNVATSITDIPSVQLFVDALNIKALEIRDDANLANYFFLNGIGANDIAAQLLSNSSDLLLIPIVLEIGFGSTAARDFATSIVDAKNEFETSILRNSSFNLAKFDNDQNYTECLARALSSGGTGIPIMEGAMVSASKKDLGRMDAIVIPIAMCVMGYTVKSLRLLILPLLSIGLSLSVSFAIMYPIAQSVSVSQAAPSLMMSLCIAMGIDYNLFLLSRFVEEVRNGHRGAAAVANTLRTAGHTVLISGLTLTISFIALIFFPTNLLSSFGIGCSLTIFIALLISLNLTPVILIAFFDFMEGAAFSTPLPACMPQWSCWEHFGFYLVPPEFASYDGDEAGDGGDETTPTRQIAGQRPRITSPVPTLEAQEGFSTVAGGDDATQRGESCQRENINNSAANSPARQIIIGSPTKKSTGGGGKQQQQQQQAYQDQQHHRQRQQSLPVAGGGGTPASAARFNASNPDFDPDISAFPPSGLLDSTPNLTGNANNTQTNLLLSRERQAQYGDHGTSVFYKLQPLLHWPWNVVSVLLLSGLVGFVGHYTLDIKITDELSSYLQRGGAERQSFLTIQREFGAGSVSPYQIMFVLESGSKVNAEHGFTDIVGNASCVSLAQQMIENFANATRTDLSHFQGPFVVGGSLVPMAAIRTCQSKNATRVFYECNKNVLVMLGNATVSPDRKAAIVTFISNVDPTGNDGKHFYDLMLGAAQWRPPITNNQTLPEFEVVFMGVGPASMDTIAEVYRYFPLISALACAAVMIMVGIAFRSVVVPIRCLLSIAFTEAFVFGTTTLVYQNGIFDFMKDPAVHSAGAVSWLTPIVAFCIVIGVALDYDIFLLTRVTEYIAHEGVSTREGTLLGLCATGGIITAAGFTMGIAFFGLLLTDMLLVNELGFMLVVAVLFDTFVVRTLLVPSVMSLLGKYHWWPSNLEGSAFSHIFVPSDSVSHRGSLNSRDGGGGGDAGGGYGTVGGGAGEQYRSRGVSENLFNPVDTGRVNKSAQLLDQQKQRLQHLFGGAE